MLRRNGSGRKNKWHRSVRETEKREIKLINKTLESKNIYIYNKKSKNIYKQLHLILSAEFIPWINNTVIWNIQVKIYLLEILYTSKVWRISSWFELFKCILVNFKKINKIIIFSAMSFIHYQRYPYTTWIRILNRIWYIFINIWILERP